MEFLWPGMLWLLLAAPFIILLYIWLEWRRKKITSRYSEFGLTTTGGTGNPGIRRHLSSLIFLVSILILIVSLARPQMKVGIPNVEGIVILAFDVSGSMAATDFSPTRMEAAKAMAREFVQNQPPSVRIGIVVFSDSGFSALAPTNKQEDVLSAINRLSPERGTSIANGIQVSLDAIASETDQASLQDSKSDNSFTPTPLPPGQYAPAVIVLLTDGENNVTPDPIEAAHTSASRGVRINTVGIGTPLGVTLEINKFVVHTQLDEATLQQISQITGGTYYNAANEQDLSKISENLDLKLVVRQEKMEITSLLAGTSIVLLLIGAFMSLLWFSRLP